MWKYPSWKATVILSIIVPMSLLVAFRLSGVLREQPTISMTTVLDSVKCGFERPAGDLYIPCSMNSSYANEIELNQEIIGIKFHRLDWWLDDSDDVFFAISLNASTQTGFPYSVNITLREEYENSRVYFEEISSWPGIFYHPENLTLADYAHFLRGTGPKAFMTLANSNFSKSVHFDGKIFWVLESAQNKTHLLEIGLDVVYWNGTVYKKVVQPFFIEIAHDDNNSFQTAAEINEGNYSGYVDANDPVDYYKIYLTQGQRVNLYVNATSTDHVAIVTISVYRPGESTPTLETTYDCFQNVEFASNVAGYWVIEVRWISNRAFYSMRVSK